MAAFHIHEDCEKENPRIGAFEKKHVLSNAAPRGLGAVKEKNLRSGLVILNNNAKKNASARIAGNKTALRPLCNTNKCYDENTAYTATTSNVVVAASKQQIASTVPVEQFKAFSVYEDQQQSQAAAVVLRQHVAVNSQQHRVENFLNKENVLVEQLAARQTVVQSSVNIHSVFGDNDNDNYQLDATPMSVSDVLSPMSVDRSCMDTSILPDTSLEKKSAVLKESRSAVPNNDRQRFFEVVEYQRDILNYFRESEVKHRPKPNYMRRQTDINCPMRCILVDWLVEVSEEYGLDTETLYLSVSYIDRFLSQMSVVRNKLQLVGTAAMYIASKYEEIYPPDVSEFVFITDDTYTKAQVLRMEQIILKILAFDLCTPTPLAFLNTYSVLVSDIPDNLKYLTQYICELSLLADEPYLRYLPSMISAASVALARYTLRLPIWTKELEEITTYRIEDLKTLILHLNYSHKSIDTMKQQAIPEKYKHEKYLQVSTIQPAELSEEIFDSIVYEYNENKDKEQNNNMTTNPEQIRQMIKRMINDGVEKTQQSINSI